jgi:copper transport protein
VLELDAVADLVDTAYGRAIVVKSLLVVLLLGAGWLNRQRTLPALGRAADGGATPGRAGLVLRRTLRVEVALGLAALAATGALAGYSPSGATASGPYSASADLGPARAELTVEPALAGSNEVHVYFFDRASGTQWDATKELTVSASLPEHDIAPIGLDARKAGPGHYVVGGAPLSPAGDWELEFVARVSEFDEYRTTFSVPVE